MPRPATDKTIAQIVSNLGASDTIVSEFVPNAGGQERLFRSQASEIFFCGGNDAGKTFCGLIMCAYYLLPEYDENGKPTGFTIHPHRKIRIPQTGMELWISTWSEKTQIDNIERIYEKILAPYETYKKVEGGARKFALFEDKNTGITSRIDFKYQTMGVDSYTGSKKHFIMLDEPHKPAIYNEARERIGKYEGTMLSTLTPVVDEDAPGARFEDIVWLKERMIDPYLDNPEDFPLREVVFASLEENKNHINVEWRREMRKGLSDAEAHVRETGMFIGYSKHSWFNLDMLRELRQHLVTNKDRYTPEYGFLEYSDAGRNVTEVVFAKSELGEFPDRPVGKWIYKIWEEPPAHESGFIRPEYHIGVDPSAGKRLGDYSSAYVKRADTGAIVAAIHGHLNEIELARQLNLLGMYYCSFNNKPAYLAVESNGPVVLEYLLRGSEEMQVPKYDIGRLYHRPSTGDLARGIGISGGEPGWYTSNRTRDFLCTAMRRDFVSAHEAVFDLHKPSPIPDVGLVDEGLRFKRDKNGKIQAMAGFYDDRLFASAIADRCIEQYSGSGWREKAAEDPGISDDVEMYFNEEGELCLNVDGLLNTAMKESNEVTEMYY